MNSLRTLRILTSITSQPHHSFLLNPIFSHACYSAQPEQDDFTHNPPFSDNGNGSDSVFDSSHFTIPNMDSSPKTKLHSPAKSTWDNKYRARAAAVIFGKEPHGGKLKIMEEEEEERRSRVLAKALLEAALETADDDEEDEGRTVKEED